MSKPYTVIGYYEENQQTFGHHVTASNVNEAFKEVLREHDTAVPVVAVEGHVQDGEKVFFFEFEEDE